MNEKTQREYKEVMHPLIVVRDHLLLLEGVIDHQIYDFLKANDSIRIDECLEIILTLQKEITMRMVDDD